MIYSHTAPFYEDIAESSYCYMADVIAMVADLIATVTELFVIIW